MPTCPTRRCIRNVSVSARRGARGEAPKRCEPSTVFRGVARTEPPQSATRPREPNTRSLFSRASGGTPTSFRNAPRLITQEPGTSPRLDTSSTASSSTASDNSSGVAQMRRSQAAVPSGVPQPFVTFDLWLRGIRRWDPHSRRAEASFSARREWRCRGLSLRSAIARAFRDPTSTTSRFPRVTAVYRRFR